MLNLHKPSLACIVTLKLHEVQGKAACLPSEPAADRQSVPYHPALGEALTRTGTQRLRRATFQTIKPRRRSRHTELQWVPRDDGFELRTAISREEFAVADAELGEMDWASIDPQPVRKSGGVRHGFTPAAYYWQRSGEHIWCESQQERWELLWLDYSAQLDLVWSQPMIINFGFDSKLAGDSHVPDFFSLTTDGDYWA